MSYLIHRAPIHVPQSGFLKHHRVFACSEVSKEMPAALLCRMYSWQTAQEHLPAHPKATLDAVSASSTVAQYSEPALISICRHCSEAPKRWDFPLQLPYLPISAPHVGISLHA